MFKIDVRAFDSLHQALKEYTGNAENAINEILHSEEVGQLAQDSIRRLMPRSQVNPWKGKKPHAKDSKSMVNRKSNLSLTIATSKNYQYLYFPNDGTTTRRHVGNQQFFERGGEAVTDDIIKRCISNLTNNL